MSRPTRRSRPSASTPTPVPRSTSSEPSAYFATDFYAGAQHLVASAPRQPRCRIRRHLRLRASLRGDAVEVVPHALRLDGAEIWLQHSVYFEGEADYWYAFAGDPAASFAGTRGRRRSPTGRHRAVPELTPGCRIRHRHGVQLLAQRPAGRARPTVALPARRSAGRIPKDAPHEVLVCADRCVVAAGRGLLPVLRRHQRPARREPLSCGVAARHRRPARGGPGAGRDVLRRADARRHARRAAEVAEGQARSSRRTR